MFLPTVARILHSFGKSNAFRCRSNASACRGNFFEVYAKGLAHGEFNKDDLNNNASQRERRPRMARIDTKKGTLEGSLLLFVCG